MQHPSFRPLTLDTRVVPVVVLGEVAQAVPLAHALLQGGINAMEITLRSPAGLGGIESVARAVPQMQVGAGTVLSTADMRAVSAAGARFAFSPGITESLVQAALDERLPFMPGVMTPSEAMRAREFGFTRVKLFPAQQAGGIGLLKALAAPLSDMLFCPTGGVNTGNLREFLALPNVAMVGGSWLTPITLLQAGAWDDITALAREARVLST